MNEPHKVLIVAFIESSRPPAYEIIEQLRHAGFSADICYAQPDPEDPEAPETKLTADLYLTEKTDLSIYEGVIFLDDGANAKNAVALAKRADKDGCAIGGYGHGCEVLHSAGLLKEKFVPANLPKDFAKGTKPVNAPAVRSDNIVTSPGGCPQGFAILMLDALGGEVEKIIESAVGLRSARAALVVSRYERWPEYWTLAERLNSSGAKIVIANWNDIDIDNRQIKRYIVLDPSSDNKILVSSSPVSIPRSIWFKQTSIGTDETIRAISSLESIGCINVNSSETIRKAMDKVVTAELLEPICNQGSPVKYDDSTLDTALDVLLSEGVRWTKPIDASLGKGVIRIHGRGQTAIVSKRISGNPIHKIVDRAGLAHVLRTSYNYDKFMVQGDLGNIYLGDKNFELRFIMRRKTDGWQSSCEIARAGALISNPNFESPGIKIYACSAAQALKTAFPDDWKNRLDAARNKAKDACIAFQSGLNDISGANELGIDITFDGAEPNVIEINSIPDLTFVDHARRGRFAMLTLAQGLGLEEQTYEDVPQEQVDNSRADVAQTLDARIHDPMMKRLLYQELSHEGIWLQDEHKLAIQESDGIIVKPIRDVIAMLRAEQDYYLKRFKSIADQGDELQSKRAASVAMRAVFRLRLVRELYYMLTRDLDLVKTADYAFNFTGREYNYDAGSVDGPWSNVRTPIRMWKWPANDEGPDYKETGQIDEETIRSLTRYHPESWRGFYAQFDLLHRNEPYPWSDAEKGDGIYPSALQYGTPQYGRGNRPN